MNTGELIHADMIWRFGVIGDTKKEKNDSPFGAIHH